MGEASRQEYRCKLEWGRHGARLAAGRGDILVVVDTLSFSTAVATAVEYGAAVAPCAMMEDAETLARRIGGVAAVRRRDVPEKGQFSLSPLTFLNVDAGTRVVLASPNGATCSRFGRDVPSLIVGALVNARAVAEAVSRLLDETEAGVTILACGERWPQPTDDGHLRMAVEDYVAAGAILSFLEYSKSAEATVCERAFKSCENDLEEIIWNCASGRELREAGFAGDVRHASQLDVFRVAPVMQEDAIPGLHGERASVRLLR